MTTEVVFRKGKPRKTTLRLGTEGPQVLLGSYEPRLKHTDGSLWDLIDSGTHGSLFRNYPSGVSINISNGEVLGEDFGFPEIESITHIKSPEFFRPL